MSTPSLEFIGTATTILRLGPFTILTDPNFLHRGQRAYLGHGLTSKRLTEPSRSIDELPDLDAVLLSHLHGDHFDRVARKGLDKSLPIITTNHAATRLQKWGFEGADGLDTWQSRTLERDDMGLTITSMPGRHGPGIAQRLLPPVMGSVLELDTGRGRPLRVYISGDTLYRPWLRQVVDRHGPIDAAVVHLGGTRVMGLLVTMDARQGADFVELIRPQVTVPIHYDDYTVFRSPLTHFAEEWRRRALPGELRTVHRGETISLQPR